MLLLKDAGALGLIFALFGVGLTLARPMACGTFGTLAVVCCRSLLHCVPYGGDKSLIFG